MDVVSHQFTRLGLQNPGFTNENTAQGPLIVIVTVDFHNDNMIIASPNGLMGYDHRFWEINAEAEESNICKKRESKNLGGSHAMN